MACDRAEWLFTMAVPSGVLHANAALGTSEAFYSNPQFADQTAAAAITSTKRQMVVRSVGSSNYFDLKS